MNLYLIIYILLHNIPNIFSYPTLPTRWVSITDEPEKGVGLEAYKYVENPTPDNPSALWSNYTDCSRLIIINNNYNTIIVIII